VLIAASQMPLREGVRLALGRGFSICAEVDYAAVAIEAARRERPDVCLIDLRLRGGAVAAAYQIAALVPETSIVVFTGGGGPDEVAAGLRAGVAGFVKKDGDPAGLAPALRAVVAGQTILPRDLALDLAEELCARTNGKRVVLLPDGSTAALTEREWDVITHVRDGFSTRQIARRMGISATTVRRHLGKVVAKLGVGSRAEAVALLDGETRRRSTP